MKKQIDGMRKAVRLRQSQTETDRQTDEQWEDCILPERSIDKSTETATAVRDTVGNRSLLLKVKPNDQDGGDVDHTDSYTCKQRNKT